MIMPFPVILSFFSSVPDAGIIMLERGFRPEWVFISYRVGVVHGETREWNMSTWNSIPSRLSSISFRSTSGRLSSTVATDEITRWNQENFRPNLYFPHLPPPAVLRTISTSYRSANFTSTSTSCFISTTTWHSGNRWPDNQSKLNQRIPSADSSSFTPRFSAPVLK